jgi:hypothetical protein
MFIIEDEFHAESQGEFPTYDAAIAELRRRSTLPWDEEPNVAPCMSWKTCGRRYEVIEYDVSTTPWREVQRLAILEVGASGSIWLSPATSENEANKRTTAQRASRVADR